MSYQSLTKCLFNLLQPTGKVGDDYFSLFLMKTFQDLKSSLSICKRDWYTRCVLHTIFILPSGVLVHCSQNKMQLVQVCSCNSELFRKPTGVILTHPWAETVNIHTRERIKTMTSPLTSKSQTMLRILKVLKTIQSKVLNTCQIDNRQCLIMKRQQNSMCICIYICVCIYIYMYVCIYTYMHIHVYICICSTHIHIHIDIHTHIYIYIYIHIYAYTCVIYAMHYMHIFYYVHIYIHIYTYTYIHTYLIHIYTHMHIYIYTSIHRKIYVYNTHIYTYIHMCNSKNIYYILYILHTILLPFLSLNIA
jgi:hypothetical protein